MASFLVIGDWLFYFLVIGDWKIYFLVMETGVVFPGRIMMQNTNQFQQKMPAKTHVMYRVFPIRSTVPNRSTSPFLTAMCP